MFAFAFIGDYKRARKQKMWNTHQKQCTGTGRMERVTQTSLCISRRVPNYSLVIPSSPIFLLYKWERKEKQLINHRTASTVLPVMVIM